tara:strand:+ start:3035 stop:3712 length:678 start_codon:yes stop_codon:yes gene_type:complete
MILNSILIADSCTLRRFALKTLISQQNIFKVIGEAEDRESLYETINEFSPQLIIIDFLSDGFDIDTIASLKREYPSIKILAITAVQRSNVFVSAMRVGVDSYIKQNCSIEEVIEAIDFTIKGSSFFCGKILESIRKDSIDVTDIEVVDLTCDPISLSKREKEVLVLISEGFTNTKIAEILFLSSHTVTTHRKNIMMKLGVKNTAGIVMYAVKSGIVSANKFLFQA